MPDDNDQNAHHCNRHQPLGGVGVPFNQCWWHTQACVSVHIDHCRLEYEYVNQSNKSSKYLDVVRFRKRSTLPIAGLMWDVVDSWLWNPWNFLLRMRILRSFTTVQKQLLTNYFMCLMRCFGLSEVSRSYSYADYTYCYHYQTNVLNQNRVFWLRSLSLEIGLIKVASL